MSADEPSSSARAQALRETLVSIFTLGDPDPKNIAAALRQVAPEDVAAVLGDFDETEKLLIYQALPSNEDRGIVLEETDQQSRREIIEQSPEKETLEVLGEMAVDDLVDQMEDLTEEKRAKILALLGSEEAQDVKELLAFAPETAGGMMTTEFLTIPVSVTSRDALAEIQGNLNVEVISYVYVTAPDDVLRGVLSIRDVLNAKPETPVESYMKHDVIAVSVHTDREEVAAVVNKYNFPVIPVVDEENRIRGIVTFDDIFDAVEEEHSEDMLRMAGTVAIHPFYEPMYLGFLKRLPFLLLTMMGGIGVIMVKEAFEEKISAGIVAAAFLYVPLLCGLSGNVAIVSATVMVRGMATGEIHLGRAWKAVGREVGVGILIALALSALVSVGLALMIDTEVTPRLGWSVGLGLCLSIAWSAFLGAIVPLLCRASGVIDPAIASGPFVTMTCDITATIIYFSLVFALL
jgi:magnesium transporter